MQYLANILMLAVILTVVIGPFALLVILDVRKKAREQEGGLQPVTTWRLHWFNPKPDITPYELALFVEMVPVGQALSNGVYIPADRTAEQYVGFIYNLPEMGRHLTPTDILESGPKP